MQAPGYFIPDRDTRTFYPLRDSQSIRAVPISVAQKYIEALTAPNDLVIDPFGMTPNVAFAAHVLGRRAIVVESNPLYAWLARAMATLPPATEINAALTKLGDALKDETPLRVHIAQLYATNCNVCGKSTPVDYFVHTREGGIIKRHYTCEQCGAERDEDATPDDLKRAQAFDAHGLHYHVAFERVIPADGTHTQRINKMLDVYTPRNLYALVMLTQKIDSLFREPRERNILLLLLLHLLDRGTSFYIEPNATAQLKAHKQFIEFNLWREIEIAAHALAEYTYTVPLADSIADVLNADTARTFIGRGNAQVLAREIPPHTVALVLSAQPTRRWGLLALAYFWGAWVLGRNAVQSLVPYLDASNDFSAELRRYADLLNDTLKIAGNWLTAEGHIVFAFEEARQFAIESLLLATTSANLNLESFLFQPRVGEAARSEYGDLRGSYRIALNNQPSIGENGAHELPSDDARETWQTKAPGNLNVAQLDKAIRAASLTAGKEILTHRGEALAYTWLHHAAYTRIAREGLLAQALTAKMKTPPGQFVHQAVMRGLTAGYAEDFDHYHMATQFVWLRRAENETPLIDRVDEAVREWFAQNPSRLSKPGKVQELEDAIYRQFPGDLTPEAGLMELCIAAHQNLDADAKAHALQALTMLGERLGYTVISDFKFQISDSFQNRKSKIENFDLVWLEHGELAHGFIWRERAQFADVTQIHVAPACGYLIVPENLVPLMLEKTRRLPHLADEFNEANWNFVRIETVTRLLELEKIERHDVRLLAGLVPPRLDQATQLELL